MYFPLLNRLKDFNIDLETIYKFDIWLSKLRGLKRNGMRPARFAVDMNVDFNISNDIFTLAAVKLRLLQINYEIHSPYENHEMITSFNNINDVPSNIRCPQTGKLFNPYDYDEFIEITFDLLVSPDPDCPKKSARDINRNNFYSSLSSIRPINKTKLNASDFFSNHIGKEEIEKALFQPDWGAYDQAYDRLIDSLAKSISTEEKGKALESISCLSLSFITFFRVDPTVHTNTNQIDVTVTIRPYFKYIEIPILSVVQRRILCECKNEDENVPSLWIDKLAGGIDKVDYCRVGILFSRNRFSGDDLKNARASQLEYARLKKYILSFTKDDFEYVKENRPNILFLLDDKIEELEMRIVRRKLSI